MDKDFLMQEFIKDNKKLQESRDKDIAEYHNKILKFKNELKDLEDRKKNIETEIVQAYGKKKELIEIELAEAEELKLQVQHELNSAEAIKKTVISEKAEFEEIKEKAIKESDNNSQSKIYEEPS